MVDWIVFVIAGLGAVAGALGVVLSRNPVHAALSLVGTLFSMAVLFVAQEAHFLAAVQVIVYAGAIVVLFLFVIMLLGVDRSEDLETEPLVGQRVAALVVSLATVVLVVLVGIRAASVSRGVGSATGPLDEPNLTALGRAVFTDYVLAFEITSLLLVIAVVGAVLLARRPQAADIEEPDLARPEPARLDGQGDGRDAVEEPA